MKTVSTSFFKAALLGGGIGFALLVGCQGQTEGERCSSLNANQDCVAPLVCTAASSLKLEDGVSRCCPDDISERTDSRCDPRVGGGSNGMGGQGGSGEPSGSGGATGEGGSVSGLGDDCLYRSDCEEGLDCGPKGKCQFECMDNIDCDGGLICTVDKRCVEP